MRIIEYIKSLFKPHYISKYDEELSFSISIGGNCEICCDDLDYKNGGYTGKPTKCESCEKQSIREDKLKKIGI